MNESLLTIKQVMEKTARTRAGVYRAIAANELPRPLRRGGRSVWVASEVQAAIDKEIATLPRMGQSTGARTRVVRRPVKVPASD